MFAAQQFPGLLSAILPAPPQLLLMNVDDNTDIYFRPHKAAHQALAHQRYISLPARQVVLWLLLEQLGAELIPTSKEKISGMNTRNP